ncbi:YezD family protein [Konateibacter massiliensis]|uniref:YezD family protein n=1 Tax=Konateibacter massiliensis TaxID=2002841 RepID=UPI001F3DFA21|nr:YezD family protein [Konateibacter massiliensis]
MIPIPNSNVPDADKEYVKLIYEMVKNMKFGSVTIAIQDGKIVQIEKIEKIRLKN